jgi:hypothetical protein
MSASLPWFPSGLFLSCLSYSWSFSLSPLSLSPLPLRSQLTDRPLFCPPQLCLRQHPQVQPGPGPRRPHCAQRVGARLSPRAATAAFPEVRTLCAHTQVHACPSSPEAAS